MKSRRNEMKKTRREKMKGKKSRAGWGRKGILGFVLAAGIMGAFVSGCSGEKQISKKEHVTLENGEIKDNSIVVGVGGEGVRYSEIRGYCYLLRKQYDASFGSELWEYPLDGNTTIGEEAKEEILNMVTQTKVIEAQAKAEKVELTADEKDEAVRQAEKVLASATDEEKKEYSLTTQNLTRLFERNLLANKMFYIATDDADVDVSDEEARQAQIQYIFLGTGRTGDDGAEIVLSKKEKKAVEKRANKLLAEARKTDHFSELAEKKSDAAQTEIIMGGNETSLPGEVVSAAMGLKTGELSTLIETSNGYYILYCANEKDADATYEKKEEIIAARQERMFKEKYSRWLGENEIEISKSFWKIFHV